MLKFKEYKLLENQEPFKWDELIKSPNINSKQVRDLNIRIILKKLEDAGIKDRVAQSNILANIQHESGFIPKTEYGDYRANRLMELWGPDRKSKKNSQKFDTLADAQDAVNKGMVHVYDIIYGNRMDNKNPGDAYKYRGRGLIQLTGKSNYKVIGDRIGVDLVSNPELANHPNHVFDIAIEYLKYRASNIDDLRDIYKMEKIVGYATNDTEQRKKTADEFYKYILAGKINPVDDISTAMAVLTKNSKSDVQNTVTINTDQKEPEVAITITPEQIKSNLQQILNFDISVILTSDKLVA